MGKSIARLRHCASAPDMDEAVTWLQRGGHRHGGGDAGEHQQRRQQEAAAHPEQARQKAHARAQRDHDQPVDRHFRDGQIDFHGQL